MQRTSGTALHHRLWGLFTPDCDPSSAFVLARAATAGVSDEFMRAANTLVLALSHFHTNAGRGCVRKPTESHPDATAHPNPGPSTPTTATPPHNAHTGDSAPTRHGDNESHDGAYDGGETSLR